MSPQSTIYSVLTDPYSLVSALVLSLTLKVEVEGVVKEVLEGVIVVVALRVVVHHSRRGLVGEVSGRHHMEAQRGGNRIPESRTVERAGTQACSLARSVRCGCRS